MVSRRRIWLRRSIALGAVGAAAYVATRPNEIPVRTADRAIHNRDYDAEGWPLLTGDISESESAASTWQVCSPRCGRAIRRDWFTPGPIPSGARVRIRATSAEAVWIEDTPRWQGRVRNVRPPTLSGNATVGAVLVPRRGRWSGGWPDGGSTVGVRACRTADAVDCVAMLSPKAPLKSVRIDPSYVGWYVGATDAAVGGVRTETTEAVPARPPSSQAQPAPSPGPTVAVSELIGPVR